MGWFNVASRSSVKPLSVQHGYAETKDHPVFTVSIRASTRDNGFVLLEDIPVIVIDGVDGAVMGLPLLNRFVYCLTNEDGSLGKLYLIRKKA